VHTRSRHEELVRGQLASQAVETFLPRQEVWSRRVDRRLRLRVPLFPGYLFVRLAPEPEVWAALVRTRGVVRVLGHGGRPAPVPEAQIESVRRLLANSAVLSPHPYLQVGRPVRVVSGPLAGCQGLLLRRREHKARLVVSLDILRQAVAVEIDEAGVAPL
jgi:transcription antitermination factor NusG